MSWEPKPCRKCGAPRTTERRTKVLCYRCHASLPPTRSRAVALVAMAVRDGRLPSLRENAIACVDCGSRASCYEHRDYAKPLDVEPVCHSCNRKRGPAIRSTAA